MLYNVHVKTWNPPLSSQNVWLYILFTILKKSVSFQISWQNCIKNFSANPSIILITDYFIKWLIINYNWLIIAPLLPNPINASQTSQSPFVVICHYSFDTVCSIWPLTLLLCIHLIFFIQFLAVLPLYPHTVSHTTQFLSSLWCKFRDRSMLCICDVLCSGDRGP